MNILYPEIHSAVNEEFISNPNPRLNEQISITIRIEENQPIKKVLIRAIIDGTSLFIATNKSSTSDGFAFYTGYLIVKQPSINYHFVIITDKSVLYYTKKEIGIIPPTEDHDFVILSNAILPKWVTESVFYQIFPDRFRKSSMDCAVKDNEYNFDGHSTKTNSWDNPPPTYQEGHCLDFYGGDLYGIIDAIPHFEDLGVNALYLNPIFSAKTHHRYDCTDYTSVDPHLGGDIALELLMKKLHEHGIKLIIDVSINHTGIDHPWVEKALNDENSAERDFYYVNNNSLRKWMGVPTLPQLNYNSQLLRDIMYRNEDSFTKKYLKAPYQIDGYRYDVGNNTARYGSDQMGNQVFSEVRSEVKNTNPNAYIIGEHWKDNISYLLGDQWDGAMNYFASSRPCRTFAGENDRFIRNFIGDNPNYLISGGCELRKQIEQHYTRIPDLFMHYQFNLLDSHDIHRFHNHKEIFDFSIYSGIILLQFMLPGTFSIYYGDEIGIDGKIDTAENTRYPMEWDKNKWDMDFFNLYKSLVLIRKTNKALHTGSMRFLYDDNDTLVIARFYKNNILIAVIYRGKENKEISFNLKAVGINQRKVDSSIIFGNGTARVENGLMTVSLVDRTSVLFSIK